MKIVERSSNARAATHDFIHQLLIDKDNFEYAVDTTNLGADFHDKIAAEIVEAWETILKDDLWRVRFKTKDEAKKTLDSDPYMTYAVYIPWALVVKARQWTES